MKILGIDPGTATTGFGLIENTKSKLRFIDAGIISTPPDEPMERRLLMIYDELTQLVTEFKPDQIAIELLYFASNVTTAITVGQARGVAMLVAAKAQIAVSEYTPLQVKQAVTGYGKADKKQVQAMVKTLLGLSEVPKPDDAADALAIAITHSQQR
ncbi:MAG: crossover junction endodeoxyribonuclease RuvC [Candidatus Saccharimonadia bacterium]